MPKTNPQEAKFPRWSEISKYGINTLNVGDTVKLHFHDAHEYWVIVEGRGIATSEGLEYELGPGDMLQTKAGDEHSLVVTERMVAVYLYGVMPLTADSGISTKGSIRLSRNGRTAVRKRPRRQTPTESRKLRRSNIFIAVPGKIQR